MTDHARWSSRLSAYLDGETGVEERAALERHLGECSDCRSVLEDLRAITAAAPGYAGSEPAHDLWPGISAAIEQRREVRFPTRSTSLGPRRFTAGHLAAAALGALGVGLGAAWLALRGPESGVGRATPATVEVRQARLAPEAAYHQAVADLERVLADGRSRLDTATVRVIEENLRLIDRAIAEAEAAIAADPGNVDLQSWVAANMRRKLDLLRRTAAAIALES